MAKAPHDRPKKGFLRDSVQIWDERFLDYQEAWEHRFNKRTKFDFFKDVTEEEAATRYSPSFYCAPYRNALMFISVSYQLTNVQTLHIEFEFSWDNVNFFPCWFMWFGYDQIVAAMMPHLDCMPIPILAPWIRVKYITTNTEANYELRISIFGVFNSV
ncbi:unnamed protein product [marine sediment metagenome]|uniref:Uncharacterized protein n=1 Tax=marine sediment metagenome TaxID=412755 RepID=X1UDJ9_9ZZZZ